MPFLENIVEGFAQAAGDQSTVAKFENEKTRRRGLEHEELQAQTQSILNDVGALHQRQQSLDPKSPTFEKDSSDIRSALAKAQQSFTDLYHPEKNPGALQHVAGFIKQHLSKRPPGPPPTTPAEARQRFAQTQADVGQVAYAPGTTPVGSTWKPLGKPFKEQDSGLYYQTFQSPDGATKRVAMPEGYEPPPPAPARLSAKKGLKYDAATDEVVDQDTLTRYTRNAPNAPQEVQDMFKGQASALATKQKNAERLANIRGQAYGLNRPISVLDSASGNAPTEVTMADIKKNPGRYVPSGPGQTALAQENLMQDIVGVSKQARSAITGLKQDFPTEMRLKLAVAMRENDPSGAIGQLVSSGALGSLTPDQQNFVIAVNQLTENAMAMRAILKTGTGAQDVREAIRSTLPGILSPDKSFALRQLDAFDKTIARLHRGVPRIALPEPSTPGELKESARQAAGRGPTGTTSFSLNGEVYDVPADKVAAFRKKHPDAKEQ